MAAARRPVGVEPLTPCLLRLLPVYAPWAVVLAGRPICFVARRVPPAVRLVRAVREQQLRRRCREQRARPG